MLLLANLELDLNEFDSMTVATVGVYSVIALANGCDVVRYVVHGDKVVHQHDYYFPDYYMDDKEVVHEYLES